MVFTSTVLVDPSCKDLVRMNRNVRSNAGGALFTVGVNWPKDVQVRYRSTLMLLYVAV